VQIDDFKKLKKSFGVSELSKIPFFIYNISIPMVLEAKKGSGKIEDTSYFDELNQKYKDKTLTLGHIIRMDEKERNLMTFTLYKELAFGNSLDKIQNVIEYLTKEKVKDGKKKSIHLKFMFFKVKLRRLSKEQDSENEDEINFGNIKNGEEYLIQLSDISELIFFDRIEMEKQQTTLINSTISHEMRNPLNSILAQLEIIKEQVGNLKEFRKLISREIKMD